VNIAHAGAERPRGGHRLATAAGVATLVARRLRLDPVPALAMAVLVVSACFVFASLPRLFNSFSDDGLRHAISKAPVAERNPSLLEPGRIAAGPASDPLAGVERRAARSQHAVLPAPLDDLVLGHSFVVRSPTYAGVLHDGIAPFLTLRVPARGFGRNVRVVSGRLPRPSGARVRTVSRVVPDRPLAATVPQLEVALSTTTAHELQMHVGQEGIFTAGFSEVQSKYVPLRDQRPIAAKVVGIFDVPDPKAAFWFGDPTVDSPNLETTPDGSITYVYAQAIVSPAAYPALLDATRPFRLGYEYRYLLDEARIDGARLPAVRDAATMLDARYAGAGPLDRRVKLGLGPVLDRFRTARSQAETLLAVAVIGLLACALACLGLLGALAYDRRRTETTLSRVRGASPLQTLGAQAAEAALIAVPAGLVGWGLAVLLVDARGSSLSAWLAAVLVAGTIVLLVASLSGVARRPLGSPAPAEVAPEGPRRRRLAIEALIAVAALLGVYLLRRRGLGSSGFGATGFDPYLAAVPLLLGLACGIVALRLYPLPLQALARLARRGRGLALHLGLSRAARQPDTTSLPVLVLVLALALATFSAAMASTIRAGQNATGIRAVGADMRIDAPDGKTLPEALVRRLGSLGDVAQAFAQDTDIAIGSEGLLLALDAPAYQAVVAGTPAAVPLRATVGKQSPIPTLVSALVSADWPLGGSFQLPLPNQTVSFLRVGDRTTFPGIQRGTPFVVVSLQALRKAGGQAPVNRLYVRGADAGAVRTAVRELAPGASIGTKAAIARGLRASPLVDGALRGFRWAVVVAALFAAVALALLVLIAARSRAWDLSLVRTMGGGSRDTFVVSLVELAPLVVLGVVLGFAVGVAIPYLIEPGLDLAFYTGSATSAISIPWGTLLALAAALVVVLLAAVLLVGLRARRTDLGRVLRVGER
jgi:putative ABC transport system permease protein